jgi:hypothetical protein
LSKGHVLLRFLRKVHLYIGIFTTPALLFFALTGAMQTFSLHEARPGSTEKPPAWIATLAQLHKKQTTVVPVRKPRLAAPDNNHADQQQPRNTPREAAVAAPSAQGPPAPPQKTHLPMKIFFLLVAVSLSLSTVTGVYMSYKYSRGWGTLTALLVAGVVVPILLLPF